MQRQDKFFIIIIIGVVLLVIVALVVMLTSGASDYKDDYTPEGVAQNYLLAIQKQEYNRAYSYLSRTIPNFPGTLEKFKSDLGDWDYSVRRRRELVFSVDSIEQRGSDWEVTVTGIRSSGDSLLGGDQSFNKFTVTLVKENELWKIKDCSNYLFFDFWWRRT